MLDGLLSGERVELKKAEGSGGTAVGSRRLRIEQPAPLWSFHTGRAVPQITETKAEWYGLGSDRGTERQRYRMSKEWYRKKADEMRSENKDRVVERDRERIFTHTKKTHETLKQRCLRHINAALSSGTVPTLYCSLMWYILTPPLVSRCGQSVSPGP